MKKVTPKFEKISCCRLCQSKQIRQIFDFGYVPLGNNLQHSFETSISADVYRLAVMNCIDCNHFQLSVAVSANTLYATNYTYLSGVGKSFVNHLKNYVDWVIKKVKLKKNSIVIDIGSNDGTCLNFFKKKGHEVCGVDPAEKPAEIANRNSIRTINKFFDDEVAKEILKNYGKVDVVTSQNVLAHVDDLKGTFENIHRILKLGGHFVFEIGYFKKVLELLCFDTIYHEHIDYHHANPLANFLIKIGFDIIDISENSIQGGSLRLLARKASNGKISRDASRFLENERKSILYDSNKLISWQDKIRLQMENFKKTVLYFKSRYEVCFAYGAPTKATLLLKMSCLDENDISFIVDDNKLKVGKFMPITGIPIKASNEIEYNKDSLIIILAWNFADDIIRKLRLKYNGNAKIVVPLPNLRVLEI